MSIFGPNINKMKEGRDYNGLIQLLNNKDLKVRIEAARALSELKYVEGLIEAVKNKNPEVRIEALSALQKINETETKIVTTHIISTDEDERVWQKAFEALSESTIAITDVISTDEDERVWQKAFEALIESKMSENWEIWANIAMGLLKNKKYQKASRCFEKVLEINKDKESIGSIGSTLLDHERYDDALNFFERFIEIDENDAQGWGAKGLTLYNINRDDEAVSCCKRALEIDPKFDSAKGTLLNLYYKKEDYENLASFAKEILLTTPDNIKTRIMLSEAFALTNKLIEAESEAKKALEFALKKEYSLPEELGLTHQTLGIIYVMRGHLEEALSEFKKAFHANKKDAWTCKLLSAYLCLNTTGGLMDGTPLERRKRLFKWADLRAESVAFGDAIDVCG